MTIEIVEKIHKFEKAGLGKAPFTLVDVWNAPSRSLAEANPEAYNRAISEGPRTTSGRGFCSCHYCGHEILTHCVIEGSDGARFFVGSDCVAKTGDKGLIIRVMTEIKKKQKDRRRELDQQKIEEFASLMRTPEIRDILEKLPHPNAHFASRGKTLLNWADFMRRCSGVAGTKKGLRIVKKAIAS